MVQKLEPFKGWKLGDEKGDTCKKFQLYPAEPLPQARKFCEIARKYVKLKFRK